MMHNDGPIHERTGAARVEPLFSSAVFGEPLARELDACWALFRLLQVPRDSEYEPWASVAATPTGTSLLEADLITRYFYTVFCAQDRPGVLLMLLRDVATGAREALGLFADDAERDAVLAAPRGYAAATGAVNAKLRAVRGAVRALCA